MAGLVPAIPIHLAPPGPTHRDRRDKPGDDAWGLVPAPRFSRGEPSNPVVSYAPPTNAGPSLSPLPFAVDAKESGTPTDAGKNHPHRPGAAPLRPDGLGGAARLSAFHRGSRQGDLRHPRRNSGHVSWDAVWPVLPTFACPSPASTSRAGHSAGRHDTQAARERAVSSRPRAPHSLSTSGIPSRKASFK
jgi:hypothetical protein